MSDVYSVPAHFVLFDIDDRKNAHPIPAKGRYYGDGRMEIMLDNLMLEVDPGRYYKPDPKRCIETEKNIWSQYRVKSCLLDSKAIKKNS